MKSIEGQIKVLPDVPGVYFFKQGRQILYIGKATSLRSRVRSYFRADLINTRGAWVKQMIERADKIDFKQTDSVLEALILESQEIKKHQPPYNTREKDDKSYLYVVITDEDFPRILTIRGKDLLSQKDNFSSFIRLLTGFDVAKNSHLSPRSQNKRDQRFDLKDAPRSNLENSLVRLAFGPFPYGSELREALKIIRKIFPYRDTCTPCVVLAKQGKVCKPCFNAQIGLCPGVCSGAISKQDYAKTIRHLKLFFEGKKSQLIKQLEREMKVEAKNLRFEKAGELKRQIFALNHIQDVALIKREASARSNLDTKYQGSTSLESGYRIEAYDIAHISGKHTVGAMVVMQDGEFDKNSYRKFKLRLSREARSESGDAKWDGANDLANLKQILERRFNHLEWPLPNLIVVDGGQAQINVAKLVLGKRTLKIPVVSVVKDGRHKAREILGLGSRGSTLGSLKVEPRDFRDQIIRLNQEAHRFAIAYHRQRRDQVI